MLQLACLWNLSQPPVKSVIPTLIQEASADSKPIETKVEELAALSTDSRLENLSLAEDEIQEIREIGNNKGCMALKGANAGHAGEPEADRWPLRNELLDVAKRWQIDPAQDLVQTH